MNIIQPTARRFGHLPLAIAAASLLSVSGGVTPAHGQAEMEFKVKAVFLLNFTKFVEWPEKAFSSPDAPIVIGVLGDDPFGAALDQAVKGEAINNHPVEVRRYRRIEDLQPCHLLYVARSDSVRVADVLQKLSGAATLTVGETEQFLKTGGTIRFTTEAKKVKFEINLDAAKVVGLKPSAQLLKLAKVTGGVSNN